MTITTVFALIIWAVFYASFFIKAILMKRRGLNSNLLGKGEKSERARRIERMLQAVTYTGATVQLGSVFCSESMGGFASPLPVQMLGLICAAAGAALFIGAMSVMKNNWRAGCDLNQQTSLVVEGLYRFSRNPAFFGFGLLYIGNALVFPNAVNLIASALALLLFHLQILEEERFLETLFGEPYRLYTTRVNRYWGQVSRK